MYFLLMFDGRLLVESENEFLSYYFFPFDDNFPQTFLTVHGVAVEKCNGHVIENILSGPRRERVRGAGERPRKIFFK